MRRSRSRTDLGWGRAKGWRDGEQGLIRGGVVCMYIRFRRTGLGQLAIPPLGFNLQIENKEDRQLLYGDAGKVWIGRRLTARGAAARKQAPKRRGQGGRCFFVQIIKLG